MTSKKSTGEGVNEKSEGGKVKVGDQDGERCEGVAENPWKKSVVVSTNIHGERGS